MFREIAISVYLFVFRITFFFFCLFPLKQKTTFIVSFNDNLTSVIRSHKKIVDGQQIITLKSHNCTEKFHDSDKDLYFNIKKPVQFLISIYHIATSTHIIIDNYHGFLSNVKFRSKVTCTQVWHAAGAIKKFGLEDNSNKSRSKKAISRFKLVYDKFDHIVVGSNSMAEIFKKSFNVTSKPFLYTGFPRTDFFFNKTEINQAKNKFRQKFPTIKGKKIILYAPTYRDNELNSMELQINLDNMYNKLHEEYLLFLRLHPVVATNFKNTYDDFIFDFSNYENINDLLVWADILITDYSSIPFEFALLKKPIIFYMYDYHDYNQSRGIIKEVLHQLPGPISYDTDELISLIQNEQFKMKKIEEFNSEWSKYSNGHSSDALIHSLFHNIF